jgi:outer membrane protein TolC
MQHAPPHPSTRRPLLLFLALVLASCAAAHPADDAVDERRAALFRAAPSSGRPANPDPSEGLSPGAPSLPGEPTASDWPPAGDGAPTLEACTRFALEHSTRLRSAFEEWAAASQAATLAGALPEPRLSYMEFVEEPQTRTGPQRRRFGLTQAFPWPGQRGQAAEVERLAAEARWRRVEAVRLEVAREVALAFHDYAFLGREQRINAELLALLRGLEPGVQGRVRSGADQRDLLRLQVEIGRLEDDAQHLARRRPALSARLADAMSLAPTEGGAEALPAPELEEPAAPEPVDVERALAQAFEHSPRLGALALEIEAARAADELAGYARRPSLGLALDYLDTGRAEMPVEGSGDDPWAVGLSMSLPVWTSRYAAAERQARHRLRAARLRADTAESALRAELEHEAFALDDAARRIGLYRDSLLPRAAETMRLSTSAYTTGGATLLDLIDAERVLLELELSFWRACKEYHQAEARLRALVGEPTGGVR